jgi:hypothetical protein
MKRIRIAFFFLVLVAANRAAVHAATDSTLRVVAVSGRPAADIPEAWYSSFDLPVLDKLGRATFYGRLSRPVPTDDEAIWRESSPGILHLVIQSGTHFAPMGTHFDFARPLVNGNGDVAFLSALHFDPGGRPDEHGLFLKTTAGLPLALALPGQPVPGQPPGVAFTRIHSPRLNERGDIAFEARFSTDDPTFAPTHLWIKKTSEPLLMIADTFEGKLISSGFYELNEAGQIAFRGTIQKSIDEQRLLQGIWITGLDGQPSLIARQEDPAPGFDPATLFSQVARPALSDSGHVAFFASLGGPDVTDANNTGLWMKPLGQTPFLAVREGAMIPGSNGETFGEFVGVFNGPHFGSEKKVVFSTNVVDAQLTSRNSVWSYELEGPLALVAREGNPAPGLPAGSVFGGHFTHLAINARGQIAFEGTFQSAGGVSGYGIWAQDPAGALHLIAHTGQTINLGTKSSPELRTAFAISFADPEREQRSSGLNDFGQLAYWAQLDDGRQAIFVSNLAVPEPGGLAFSVAALFTGVLNYRARCVKRASNRGGGSKPQRRQNCGDCGALRR